MALFRPYKITSDQLSSLAKAEGQLIVVSDTNEMYIDVSNTSRIRIGESLYTKLANIAEGATKVEASSTNGKIKINGTDTTVYTHPTTTAASAAAVKVGKDASGHVVLGNALTASDVGAASSSHTHTLSMATDTGTSSITLAHGGKYKLTAGGNAYVFTMPSDNNTTYTFATGDSNGQIAVTPSGGSKQNVSVKGLAALAYKSSLTASEVGAIATSAKGAASGVAELDENGKVPTSQLPGFVDDVIEGYYYNSKFYKESAHTTEITGESGKIYVDLSTNKTYRYSGTAYVEISSSLALGETSSTAYRGDRGKTAYDHSQLTSGNPHNVTKSDVGLGNVGNFKAVSTVASQGLTDTEKSNARANIGAGTSNLTIGTTSSTAAAGNHTHTASLATDTGTSAITLASAGKYKLTAGGGSVIFTMPTIPSYSSKAATEDGTDVSLVTTGEKYIWNNKSDLTIGTTATTAAAGNHTHELTIAADSGTSALTLSASTKYKITAGGSTFIFTTPADNNTKNTAGSTDTSNKIFLIGATSQAANPQTYSHDTAYVGTDGHLYSDSKQVVNLSGSQALTNKTYNGYTLAAACAKGVDTSLTISATSTNLPTSAAVAGMVSSALTWNTL